MKTLNHLFNVMLNWFQEEKQAAMATLVRTSGSSPLEVGARMVISDQMEMVGAVSRGCVESAVVELAQEVIKTDQGMIKHFGISDQTAWEVGLTCGGEIDVAIEPILNQQEQLEFLKSVVKLCEEENPFTFVQVLSTNHPGTSFIISHDKQVLSNKKKLNLTQKTIRNLVEENGLHSQVEIDGKHEDVFIQHFKPANRLILIGAVEIAIKLMQLGKLLGFHVIINDPRKVFASNNRFPEADELITHWPQEYLPSLSLRRTDYVAVVSHDEKIDIPALDVCLQNEPGYIGLLGSKKTVQQRFASLKELGWDEKALKRIHAPIGLNIGSKSAEEIALSILAEIVQIKNS